MLKHCLSRKGRLHQVRRVRRSSPHKQETNSVQLALSYFIPLEICRREEKPYRSPVVVADLLVIPPIRVIVAVYARRPSTEARSWCRGKELLIKQVLHDPFNEISNCFKIIPRRQK